MSGLDKARNKLQKLRGKADEVIGRASGDLSREAQGRDAQRGADLKDAGEKIKDVVRPKGARRRHPR